MGSLPDSKYIIQTDGYWFVEAHDVDSSKGHITVSAKGIANGLSSIPNDGADFGPDTYNPDYSGSGIPYTQTSGIQEAINYIDNQNGGSIHILDGKYDLTNAPFSTYTYSGIDYSFQIVLPSRTTNDDVLNISITCNTVTRGGVEGAQAFNLYSGGVTLYSTATPPSGTQGYIMGGPTVTAIGNGTPFTNINLHIDGLHFQTQYDGSLGGLDLLTTRSVVIGKIYIDTNATDEYPITISSSTGFAIQGSSSVAYVEFVSVVGYSTGINLIPSHIYFGKIMLDMCEKGIYIVTGSQYGTHVGLLDFQNTKWAIIMSTTDDVWLSFGMILQGDQNPSGGPYPYDYVSTINDTESGSGVHNVNAIVVSDLASNYVTPVYFAKDMSRFNITHMGRSPTPSLSSNPPASATAYQNTNPYDIIIYLPAYATASGTAGSVAVAIGSSSSPSTTFTQFVSGSTSSSSPDTIQIKVPAGWYYEVTTTGVTLATATVVAD